MSKQKALFQSVLLATAVLKTTEVKLKPTRHPHPNMELLEIIMRKIMDPTSRENIFPERKELCIKGLGLATLACYACFPVLSILRKMYCTSEFHLHKHSEQTSSYF